MNNPESERQGKGFQGLMSLGSPTPDLATDAPPLSERSVPELSEVRVESAHPPVQPPPSKSHTSSRPWRGWVVGLGVFAALGGFFIFAGNQSSSVNSDYSATAPELSRTSTEYSPSSVTEIAPTPHLSGEAVTMPPVGTDHVLSSDQIRYCVYEDRRIKGAEKVVDSYNQVAVDTFNRMVDDYNSRCSSFRYRAGTLTLIQEDANAIQTQLEQEGRERMSTALALAGDDAATAAADAAAASADVAAAYSDRYVDPYANSAADAYGEGEAAASADAAAASADAAAAAADAAAAAAEAAYGGE